MLSRITIAITAVSLALTAQASAAAPAKQKACPGKTHQTTKVAAVKPAKPSKWGGGGAGAQMRRTPDVQILSFGP